MAKILDGKLVASLIKEQVKKETTLLKDKGIVPGLAVVLVGDDSASQIYVNNKKKACEFVGFFSKEIKLSKNTTQNELIDIVNELNNDDKIDAILVQLPLPPHINENDIIESISPDKDVDGFTMYNMGKVMSGNYSIAPCTPAGIIEILKYYNISLTGKECVVIGRSNIVGKPMAMMMLHNNCTVTICHSKTKDLNTICRHADIIISDVGKSSFVTANMVKDNAIVIDVGMNRDYNNKLCGDVCYSDVIDKVYAITPVPGGVGPMTIAMLMKNTLYLSKMKSNN